MKTTLLRMLLCLALGGAAGLVLAQAYLAQGNEHREQVRQLSAELSPVKPSTDTP